MRNNLHSIIGCIFAVLVLASCEDYLDKAPEANYTDRDVYGNFQSFQGFIEEMYACIIDPDKAGAWNKYLFADETLNNYVYAFDQGNYWGNETYFFGQSVNTTTIAARNKRIWEYAWFAIDKANLALEKIEEPGLFVGTDEEKNLLKGQALFFRGWFYFEICRFWGGMPYINRVIDWSEPFDTEEFKRLSFKETAVKMAADFEAAAKLLPDHWDNIETGKATLNNNQDRINKFFALGYLGKALLFAASPMPNEEAGDGDGKTYDAELCRQAANAFGELLELSDNTKLYKLETWANWTGIFYKYGWGRPGGAEVIMEPTVYDRTRVRNSTLGAISPADLGLNSGNNADVPTHNLALNFGDKRGYPINDPESQYDPADPWNATKRDPRFAKTFAVNGEKIANFTNKQNVLKTYNGGFHREVITQNPPTVTGYYQKKFNGLSPTYTTTNAGNLMELIPYLRMADIYLMYSEAVLFSPNGSPSASSERYSMTAKEAFDKVRFRATGVNLADKFAANNDVFFEEIVRERAVELALEGQRFCDLRRWNRNSDPRYLDKTCIDFDEGAGGKPINMKERVIIRRVAQKKHNWLPIQVKFTKMYKGFPQNPGW